MRLAVLSGKGGTGKTTVSASLALSLGSCQYVDCDVEEPNGALFLNPDINRTSSVKVLIPKVDEVKCTGCGKCAKACRFNAIAVVSGKVLIFPEICHHCGACKIACPQKAVYEVEREVGVIESDYNNMFLQGRLNIGESAATPVLRELKKSLRRDIPIVLDCPHGASCAVIEAIDGSDYCILVTEPTPFGLHDLKIAVSLVRKMNIAFGVVINKAIPQDTSIQDFCRGEGIKVLMEIPFLREIAENYSKGILPVCADEEYKNKFIQLYYSIKGDAAT